MLNNYSHLFMFMPYCPIRNRNYLFQGCPLWLALINKIWQKNPKTHMELTCSDCQSQQPGTNANHVSHLEHSKPIWNCPVGLVFHGYLTLAQPILHGAEKLQHCAKSSEIPVKNKKSFIVLSSCVLLWLIKQQDSQ